MWVVGRLVLGDTCVTLVWVVGRLVLGDTCVGCGSSCTR